MLIGPWKVNCEKFIFLFQKGFLEVVSLSVVALLNLAQIKPISFSLAVIKLCCISSVQTSDGQ